MLGCDSDDMVAHLAGERARNAADWGEEQIGKRTTVYAVVEYLAGGSLRDLFDRGRSSSRRRR